MYYTITLNPAIDMLTKVENFELGKLNRTGESDYVIGGKGINISLLLNNIGKESKALGFIAGFTGNFIKEELKKKGIKSNFVETRGFTRINIKLTTDTETEINSQSSKVAKENIKEFFDTLEELSDNDTVFLSGNIIPGMDSDDFAAIAKKVREKGAKLVVDSNKDMVLDTLKYKPFIIKPNEFELGEMFGVKISNTEEIAKYAKKLQEMGAENVLVSRGSKGAILFTNEGDVFTANTATGKVISTIAAGDSMLAMFVAKYDETGDYRLSLQYASAAGGATSFSAGVGKKKLIDELLSQINVDKM
ncbi:1-phosphofructokinase [Lachnoanaerobaculum sp. Marseille-Q4761]|jgi:1-phosphofructokinase|uniref:1-phosphofructokinase n=1 Tax=Lachnoanaerobaculum sp. Marseille-Q4761 TaxID=2819511 RepID=UPI001AA0E870|nr:1-phosphofructokinase [Lachnoanaerobaculum sp. Marseille-Q4761]MBO1872052.1 1-phosphofructokinase [Lachnoanaerobaculum sp. Marseille-Q4761]